MMGSKPMELDATDLAKIGRGFGVAISGAVLTWMTTVLIPSLNVSAEEAEGGGWRSLALLLGAAVASSIVNTGRKYLADNS